MFGHFMLCLMPIAAATDDLDDLDELIQEVAEWLSQFKSLAVMAKLAKINSEFMELRSDGQTDIPADRLKFRSEEHTSELQSLMRISYAVFCLKKKTKTQLRKVTKEINSKKKDDDFYTQICKY